MMTTGSVVELDRSELWNKAETSEKRKDSRTAREVIVNIPHELPVKERIKLIDGFSKSIAEKYKCGVDYAMHEPSKDGDNRNHHAHIMITTRTIELDDNGKICLKFKTPFEWENKKLKENNFPTTQQQIKDLREHWSERVNIMLERNNIDVRIDHRSFKEQGKDMTPTKKMGVNATQLERKGIRTEVGDFNRQVKADRAIIAKLEKEVYLAKGKLSVQKKLKERAELKSQERPEEQKEITKSEPSERLSLAEKRKLWKQQKDQPEADIKKPEPKAEPQQEEAKRPRGMSR